jgi:hypothetical protein
MLKFLETLSNPVARKEFINTLYSSRIETLQTRILKNKEDTEKTELNFISYFEQMDPSMPSTTMINALIAQNTVTRSTFILNILKHKETLLKRAKAKESINLKKQEQDNIAITRKDLITKKDIIKIIQTTKPKKSPPLQKTSRMEEGQLTWTKRKEIRTFIDPGIAWDRIKLFLKTTKTLNVQFFHNLTTSKVNINPLLSTLSLGPKHIPKPTPHTAAELSQAYSKFERSIHLYYHFKHQQSENDPDLIPSRIRNKKPNFKTNQDTLTYTAKIMLLELKDIIRIISPKTPQHTLRSTISKISSFISSHPEIKLCLTDKNLGICALDTTQYHDIVMKHLNDPIYIKILKNTNLNMDSIINNMIKERNTTRLILWKDPSFLKQEDDYLLHDRVYSLPKFRITPKIHKAGPLKGRPIIGATNSVTTPASILLDTRLQSYPKSPHILQNSLELKNKLYEYRREPGSFFVTMDVSSLYTNIKIELLLQSLNQSERALTSFICNNNYFTYNEHIFKQSDGLAMGTNAAVNLANHYMLTYIDNLFLENNNLQQYHRFIDDLFFIWSGSERDLWQFQRFIESPDSNPTGLKFTIEVGFDYINFLDISLYVDYRRKIQTTLFRKPLNNFLYIPHFTHHPPACLTGFIKGELFRIQSLCSTSLEKNINIASFFKHLIYRGYPKRYLEHIYLNSITRSLKIQEDTKNFILRYSAQNYPLLNAFFKDNRYLLKIHDNSPIAIRQTYSNSPNLGSILLRTELTNPQVSLLKDRQSD